VHNTSLLRRFGAIVYDTLLIIALLFLVTIFFVALRGGEPMQPGEWIYSLTLFATMWSFFIGFWVKAGRTLGMQSWELRIETMNGEHPDCITATIRFFAALLSWLPFGLGYWWQLWDTHNLTWHDRISGTRLLHDPKGSRNES